MTKIAIKLISLYRLYISPLLGCHCRFYPSCSQYFQEALATFGLIKGSRKGLVRLLLCHPFSAGGYYPVAK